MHDSMGGTRGGTGGGPDDPRRRNAADRTRPGSADREVDPLDRATRAIQQLECAIRLKEADLSPTAADRLLGSLELVAAAKQALEAIEMQLLVEAEDVNAAVRRRGHRLRRWWANETGVCRPEASERVRVACRLAEWFPLVFDALQRGEISFAHAARLIRAATPEVLEALKELQPHLIRLATNGTFEQFERDLLLIVDRLNPDGTQPDESRVNQLRVTNEFGNTRISGLFDPIKGEIVANALKHGVDAIRREREQSLAADPGSATEGPDAGAGPATNPAAASSASQGNAATDHHSSDSSDSAHPTDHDPAPTTSGTFDVAVEPGHRIGALQADSLLLICQTALSSSPLASSIPTAHIDVIVHADDRTFAVTRNNNAAVAADTLNNLVCNGIFRMIEIDETGTPLRMGRASRLATADQRRAVFARDGGCVFPGCGAPARECDVHHVRHWSNGGPTDVENLATLCRFHHSVTHTNGWAMARHDATAAEPHHFEWTTPTGATVRSEHRQPGAAARSIQPPPEQPPTPPTPNL